MPARESDERGRPPAGIIVRMPRPPRQPFERLRRTIQGSVLALGAALSFPYFSRRLVWGALTFGALCWAAAGTLVWPEHGTSGTGQQGFLEESSRREVSRPPLQGGVGAPDERAALDVPAALPAWVQAVRTGTLWSAPAGGERVARLSQWQYLRVLGAEQGRLRVVPAEADATLVNGWADLDDVGLSGSPPEWGISTRAAEIFVGPDGGQRLGLLPGGRLVMMAGSKHAERAQVYVPGPPTDPSTGYGWVDGSLLVVAERPLDVALPSPSLKLPGKDGPATHRVRPGDTVAGIGSARGLAPSELLKLNGLEAAPGLIVGQTLQLPADRPAAQSEGPRKVRDIAPGWVSAEYAVVVDAESGQVLWARDAYTPVAPASLTKIVTALVALDHARLSDLVRVRVDSRLLTDSTVMGIFPGEELTVEDLLYGLMLPSGNDAALALAEHVAGTREAFAQLMNARGRSLGLTGSTFVNPHGLDAAGHLSSAYDMAMFARAGLRDPVFQALSAARVYETPRGKGYQLYNLNALLWRYPGADGVKIGYTDDAGRSIVGSATRDGHRVIVAMTRSSDHYADSATLLNWAFTAHEW